MDVASGNPGFIKAPRTVAIRRRIDRLRVVACKLFSSSNSLWLAMPDSYNSDWLHRVITIASDLPLQRLIWCSLGPLSKVRSLFRSGLG